MDLNHTFPKVNVIDTGSQLQLHSIIGDSRCDKYCCHIHSYSETPPLLKDIRPRTRTVSGKCRVGRKWLFFPNY